MTREQSIERGKLWQVYRDSEPDTILFECRSESACVNWIRAANLAWEWKRGLIRIGKVIWER